MKKKIFALMMAAAMVSAFGMTASAEETPEINWEDVADQIADNESWDGDFVTFEELNLAMYVPSAFEQCELGDEDLEAGYIAYFALGEDAAVGVQYVDMDGMELADYAALLTDEFGVTDARLGLINGYEALEYTNPDDETVGVVAFPTERGYIVEFSFAPINDESFQSVAGVMVASIQGVENLAEEETEA